MLNIFKKEIPVLVEPISNIRDLVHDGNDYFSDEFIILDEKLTGNLFCAEKVVVELRGILKGNITSKTCLVTGTVNGDILSLDLLDIKATAVVRGNIQSAKVNIEPGAVINGYITVGEDIEALTEQWNKTKFSTDDYLTTKLHRELSTLTQISTARPVTEQKIEPAPAPATKQEAYAEPKSLIAATSPKEETEEQAPVAKSTVTAAAPPKKDEEINNSRWW